MSKSPGHEQHPKHQVKSRRLSQRMSVTLHGEPIAESHDVIRVDEDGAPPRFYFPRGDVRMDILQPSPTTSKCPFKGTARYFNVSSGGTTLRDAEWSYEQPYDEHLDLKDRLAFYDDKVPQIHIGGSAMVED